MKDQVLRNIYNEKSNNIRVHNEDYLGRESLNSLFGDKIVGSRKVYIANQFVYGIERDDAIIEELNGATISVENSLLKGSTGTNVDGFASIQTKRYIRYKPGFDTVVMFTAIFSEPKVDSYQHIGLFDDNDGVFIGYDTDGVFKLFRRNSGTTYKYTLDTSVLSFDIDFTKGNIYRINYGYLGFAPIVLEVLSPTGKWEELYFIEYPNQNTLTNIGNTYLSMRGEVGNDGNNTDIVLKSGSIHASVVDGVSDDLTGRYNNYNSEPQIISSGDTIIVAFKNVDAFMGVNNKIASRLKEVIGTPDLNKIADLRLIKNPTITNTPIWVDIDTDNSVMQYSTDITVDLNTGNELFRLPISKTGQTIKDFTDKNFLLFPNEIAVFVLTTTGSGEFSLFLDWNELF